MKFINKSLIILPSFPGNLLFRKIRRKVKINTIAAEQAATIPKIAPMVNFASPVSGLKSTWKKQSDHAVTDYLAGVILTSYYRK